MTATPQKILWWAALASIALVVLFAQLDRYSRYTPGAATLVPDGFRSFGRSHIASAALQEGTPEQALREARQLINRRPLRAENLALLSVAQSKNAAFAQSQNTLHLASFRGWRGSGLQLALLERSLANENGIEAARRFAALLATDGNEEALRVTAPRVFALPEARIEMARLLANRPRWQDRFERIDSQNLGEENYQLITPK